MKIMHSPRRQHYMARFGIFLIAVALIAGMVSCGEVAPPVQYDLTISTTEGGLVTAPGEGTFTYNEGEKVNLAAIPDEGYQFASWTGDVGEIADVEDATTTITMKDDYSITATFAVKQYNLVIHSTEGGSVTTPGEDAYTYDKGEVVNLVAVVEEDYVFMNWTGDVSTIADVDAASTTITMNGGYSITANFAKGISDWYDLDAMRDNLDGSYVLMNDLDSTTAGYEELASAAANGGTGWQPIGGILDYPIDYETLGSVDAFTGTLDGRGYEIRGLFANRPNEDGVGLFGFVSEAGVVKNIGLVNAQVIGGNYVGAVVGGSWGTLSTSYAIGSVSGRWGVGGLVGQTYWGIVSDCYCKGSATGEGDVAGLVGCNQATVSGSHFTGSVAGGRHIGGLVGTHSWGTVSNSHYNYDEVLINAQKTITIGALYSEDFEDWLANDRFLDVNKRLSKQDGYYHINNIVDFKQLLAFGQDVSLRFRLQNDLDLGNEANFYIPYLAGAFDGNGCRILNLSLNLGSISDVGLFGYVGSGGTVTRLGVENVDVTGHSCVGSLVGDLLDGTISDCYCNGSVTGNDLVGGLVGWNFGTLNRSYFVGSVSGTWGARGLVGMNTGTVSNSHYDYDRVLINRKKVITIGALFHEDFEQWLADDKFLDVDERLVKDNGYYLITNVADFKQLLVFGQDGSLKFRLETDLDLCNESDFYIPYLGGEFDGNGHRISNLSFTSDFAVQVGLFGYLAHDGKVSQVDVENTNITCPGYGGGLVGDSKGIVSNCYSTGRVMGGGIVGGLVGESWGTVSNSCSSASVTGDGRVGGLIGWNNGGTVGNSYATGSVTGNGDEFGGLLGRNNGPVSNSYSAGSVTGDSSVGGLVGTNVAPAVVNNSFWDREASGIEESGGGIDRTTVEMKNLATYSGAGWNIIAVAPGEHNTSYIWNIVDGQTYPFLSWQS